ncbi:hypothetical protein G7Y89_g9757 [Cudoniella acicularis]|uniref:Ubiquitin 3 binding protein But2 C-terminal domain-containing protein n=1 Tax=Cudoniella acicularis TaxID=354080 RepID=A0A8H4W1K7_9HELO|nr:hypothetical protein G7Y89_g9757 [Cudoniella acicularis]
MRASTAALALFSLLGLTTATPTPVDLAPRCGQTILPYNLQQLDEASPSTVYPNTISSNGNFHVEQTVGSNGNVYNRIYQIAAFANVPANSYACQLNVIFPDPTSLTETGNPTLNVTTLYLNSPSSITYPNNWSWSTFFPPTSPPLGQGLFGTINLEAGQTAAINSEVCPNGGGNLAFLFTIASWVSESSSVDFTQYVNGLNGAGLTGVYLTYDC